MLAVCMPGRGGETCAACLGNDYSAGGEDVVCNSCGNYVVYDDHTGCSTTGECDHRSYIAPAQCLRVAARLHPLNNEARSQLLCYVVRVQCVLAY